MDKKTQNPHPVAAGIVQAVIASGADPSEWPKRTQYGLRLANYFAARLGGEKPELPKYNKESN